MPKLYSFAMINVIRRNQTHRQTTGICYPEELMQEIDVLLEHIDGLNAQLSQILALASDETRGEVHLSDSLQQRMRLALGYDSDADSAHVSGSSKPID